MIGMLEKSVGCLFFGGDGQAGVFLSALYPIPAAKIHHDPRRGRVGVQSRMGDDGQAKLKPLRAMGRVRIRLPLAAKTAFAMAPRIGGSDGSPRPVGPNSVMRKKIKGRKRHIAVDTQGNLLAVVVHSAGVQDRVGARAVRMRLFCRFDSIPTIFADGGYTGKRIEWAKEMFGYRVEVVKRNELHKFQVLPKRWIVERTFSWLNWSRRLSKDYEIHHTSVESMIYIAFAHMLLRRSTWFLDSF